MGWANEFLWNLAADDRVLKDETAAALEGFSRDLDVTELTATTRLAHELAFNIDFLGDRLAVRDLRRTDIAFDLELAA